MFNFLFKKPKNIQLTTHKFVLDTFLKLTACTYPYGFEDMLIFHEYGFPKDLQKDEHGNYFYKIGESKTIFTSHLDTSCKDMKHVNHVFEGNMIKTDGTTILGADDKAGVTIMLFMIKNKIPGLYYFFIGEEVGCVGSKLAAKTFKGTYNRCISFDRRGTDSVITFQSASRCCSNNFATQLSKELNKSGNLQYKNDSSGIYTDSAEFTDLIPECTNISVGYYSEHTTTERQDIEHLTKLADACLLVDWESLVTERDPSVTEYDYDYGYGGRFEGYGTSAYGNRGFNSHNNWRNRNNNVNSRSRSGNGIVPYSKTYGYHDDFYDDVNRFQNEDHKSTRRSKKKKNKSRNFYDAGNGELIPITSKNKYFTETLGEKYNNFDQYYEDLKSKYDSNHSVYSWTKSKLLDGYFDKREIEIIKDQYLDMNSENDRLIYDILKDDKSR